VRCIELHTYAPGGSLETACHRDNGSLSLSLLLSESSAFDGGRFITYYNGAPVVHDVGRGDAVLFPSL